ncbi:hypothetical protein F4680DRAFT_442244 [Xylaria scruposa]|nr:hypothetical protein F4680DRAFT_442244 [Xylaria scruposa]
MDDSEVIVEWLGHLDSSSPPESELVVWPPTPRTLGYCWRLHWEAERQAQTRAGTDEPAEQQRVGVNNELAFLDRSWKAPTSTPPTFTTRSLFSKPFPQLNQPSSPPSDSDAISSRLPSTKTPESTNPSTKDQGPTPSKIHMKYADDLKKLDKPVALNEGFLPAELRSILDAELCLQEQNARPVQQDEIPSLSASIHVQSLTSELNVLRTIRNATLDHLELGLAEASWNGDVHGPMLRLATLHTPSIFAANVTCATIAEEFKPKVLASTLTIPADSKMIDYAMVLRPGEDGEITGERIAYFLDTLDYPAFNQSDTALLERMPSGVFIETKTSSKHLNEAKIQLGIWLASWFDRVSRFPCDDPADRLPPPDIPLIIIQGAAWELWFAFNGQSAYEICGPIHLGLATELLDLYRILAVLRVLAQWMATDFHKWVDGCLKSAGV